MDINELDDLRKQARALVADIGSTQHAARMTNTQPESVAARAWWETKTADLTKTEESLLALLLERKKRRDAEAK